MTQARRFGMLPKMSSSWRSFACFCGSLLFAATGCTSGTETGNPSITGQLSYTGLSSAPSDIGVREPGSLATVQNAWFDLDDVAVSSEGDCGIEARAAFTVDALGIGDHAAGVHNSTAFEARAGAFCSVQLPFLAVATNDTDAPPELRGHAIVVAGELADGTPFSIESDKPEVVRLESAASGFGLDAGEADALVAFDFALWLKDVDLVGATVEAGRITVSEASNTELLRKFEDNVTAGVTLYRDADADGVLDADPTPLARAR